MTSGGYLSTVAVHLPPVLTTAPIVLLSATLPFSATLRLLT